ncbi:MAG: DoxX family protein [Bacteroidota bacterium]
MTLNSLIINIGIVALVLTLLTEFVFKARRDWITTFFQNFTGALFIFSGWVKAIDPLGTAYKMEQYFAEFEYTFQETALSFLAPMFPWLASFSISFSVFMIVFEIVLGIALLVGARPKFTAWAFLLLVGFFTLLTGFTYLTGHVPSGVNFFEFAQWGDWVETNMKVTDCGCFGDFLKLKPKVSFFKDIFLLVPAFWFVFRSGSMHQLFGKPTRTGLLAAGTVGFLIYCLSNYVWDLPHLDFRPFKVGTDILAVRQAEQEAQANIKVVAYQMTNKQTGEVVELPYAQFLKEYKSYPKEDWDYEQIKTKPEIEPTKISDFALTDAEGNDLADEVLNEPNYNFMVVSYKLYGTSRTQEAKREFPVFSMDTIPDPEMELGYRIERKPSGTEVRTIKETVYNWDDSFATAYRDLINPFADAAIEAGFKVYGIAGGASSSTIDNFREATEANYPIYEADDILLKTIVRSNPGVVLLKNGKIIMKWHQNKLPSFAEVQSEYLK